MNSAPVDVFVDEAEGPAQPARRYLPRRSKRTAGRAALNPVPPGCPAVDRQSAPETTASKRCRRETRGKRTSTTPIARGEEDEVGLARRALSSIDVIPETELPSVVPQAPGKTAQHSVALEKEDRTDKARAAKLEQNLHQQPDTHADGAAAVTRVETEAELPSIRPLPADATALTVPVPRRLVIDKEQMANERRFVHPPEAPSHFAAVVCEKLRAREREYALVGPMQGDISGRMWAILVGSSQFN